MSVATKLYPVPRGLADMLGGLADPRLNGAACVGHHELYSAVEGETQQEQLDRERTARNVCAWCPVLDQCAEVTEELHPSHRAGMTWAGVTWSASGTRPARNTTTNQEP